MKCSHLFRTKLLILIAIAVSLSNSLYAQTAAARTASVSTNDDCSKAILLETKLMSTFLTFSMESAGRSANTYRSICEEPNEIQQAVWFKTIMPSSGKLNVHLQCDNEMPRITVFYGECEKLSYLACDVSSDVNSKMMTIIAKQLIAKEIFIRVARTTTLSKEFEIKVENPSIPPVSIKDFSLLKTKAGINCQWTAKSDVKSFQFQLQHSNDGEEFANIFSEEGQDNNTYKQHYFIHEHPDFGENIYRLVLILEDGERFTIDEKPTNVDTIH